MSQLPEANAESRLPGASPTISVAAQRCLDTVSRAVCRIDFPDRDSGTGILLGGRWLLTCHHVLPSRARAGQVKAIIFGYERDESGQLYGGTSLRLAPDDGFHTSNPSQALPFDQHDDWALVRVAADPKLADFGQAQLHEDAIIQAKAYARIIQHPGVAEKSSAEGRIDAVQDGRITYRINTEGGSSGSPVLNIEGKIIALHHRGTDQTQPYHNSGVAIQRVIAGIKALKNSPWPDLCKPPCIDPSAPDMIRQPPARIPITVIVPDAYHTFDTTKAENLRYLIANEAGISPEEVTILRTRPGSTEVDILVPENVANRILASYATGQGPLRDRGIIQLNAERPSGRGAKPISLRLLRTATWAFVGRENELSMLDEMAARGDVRIVSLIGAGGIGKTTLVAAWLSRIAARNWAEFETVFDWSFYSQGTRDQATATSEVFIHSALEHFGDPSPNAGDTTARATRLANLIGGQRCLLVLDGLEPLQYAPGPLHGALKDSGMAVLLRSLAARNAGLCIVTSRCSVRDLSAYENSNVREVQLSSLSTATGVSLLRSRGVDGPEEDIERAVQEVGGHALTLDLIGQFLRLTAGGDIRQRNRMKLADAEKEYKNDATRRYGHAFKAIEAYERWFADGDPAAHRQLAALRLLGLFDRPATDDCLAALREGEPIPVLTEEWTGTSAKDWNTALSRLQEIGLVSVGEDGAVDCHPLVREYFALRLKDKHPDAFRAGHSRLFDHLCATTPHRPDTLAGLQPLYQAVTHGCLAGRQQDALYKVYIDRILRGTGYDGFYSTRRLGAFGADLGAVAAFFDEPWTRLSPHLSASAQAWLLNQAALNLRALGRLAEALEPMRAALNKRAQSADWRIASTTVSNLSKLEVTLGLLSEAVADGRRAIEFADRSGDAFHKLSKLCTAAEALHQTGERAEAEALFAEAERIQAKSRPELPLLYSLAGFRYADLLLAPAERAAWQRVIAERGWRIADTPSPSNALAACAEAERRARQTLEWSTSRELLLDIALDHLTQARAALYRALLTGDHPALRIQHSAFDDALAKLRVANTLDLLPQALLTAALYHGTLGGDPGEAARLLDEAQQIAERGPMPLYLADVHLHRARLAGRMKEEERIKSWPGVDPRAELTKARTLIEQHGYWRRREELADAEVALA